MFQYQFYVMYEVVDDTSFLEEAADYLHMAVPTLRLHRSKVGNHVRE